MQTEDQKKIMHVMRQVALKSGTPLDEVMQWPWERVQPIIDELVADDTAAIRIGAARAVVFRRIAGLFERASVPQGMTLEQAIDARYFTEDEVEAAKTVSEKDIDTYLEETT